jgi:hypothetical protein
MDTSTPLGRDLDLRKQAIGAARRPGSRHAWRLSSCMDRAVSASLLPCHGCRSGTGSDRAPAHARSSSLAGASRPSVRATASRREQQVGPLRSTTDAQRPDAWKVVVPASASPLPRCGSAWLGKRASADASSLSTRASSDSRAQASGEVAVGRRGRRLVPGRGVRSGWSAVVGGAFSCRWPAPCWPRRDR